MKFIVCIMMIVMGCCNNALNSMDDDESPRHQGEMTPHKDEEIPLPKLPPLPKTSSIMDMSNQQLRVSKNSPKNEQAVTPKAAAAIAHTVTFIEDPGEGSPIHQQLEKTLTEMQKSNPEQYAQIVKRQIAMQEKLGTISADNIKKYRSQKKSSSDDSTPKSSSSTDRESQKKQMRKVLKRQSTIEEEVKDQKEDLLDIKDDLEDLMKQLTLRAAEDAHKEEKAKADEAQKQTLEEQKKGRRWTLIGTLVGAIGSATVSALIAACATYYGAVNAARIAGGETGNNCPPCVHNITG